MFKRTLFCIIGIIITVAMLVYGIKSKELMEIERNATLLCLSCVGIG